MANASMAIQVLPKCEEAELFAIVDRAIDYIRSFGLRTVVGPFETVVEGDFDELLTIAGGCQKICVEAGAESVMCYIKFHYSPKGVYGIDEKIKKHE